ncbi:MAG: molybdopterin-containing oxidoreductase family protein [Candidatus Zhuqueibacterota bacterium]
MIEQNLNRRKFIKYTSAGLFSTLFLNEFSPLFAEISSSGKNVSFLSEEFRKGTPTFCNLCPAQCGLIGFFENDWLMGIQGNPRHPNNRGKICARGIAGMNLVYDPNRPLTPLKRKGKRGAGSWEKISWQEALREIAERLRDSAGRSGEIIFNSEERYLTGLSRRFIRSLGDARVITSPVFSDLNKNYAQKITWGARYEIPDVEHSDFILSFGANFFESHPLFVAISQRVIEAKMNNGARLVTVDPRMSNTAGRSAEWLPIMPGTDALLALTLANVIVQNQLHDADFIARWTNISASELQSYLSQFTPEKAESICTIPAQKIRELAIEFARRQHPVAVSGSGVTRRSNGVQNERSIMLLNAVVGNIDQKGGYCLPQKFDLSDFGAEDDLSHAPVDFYQALVEGREKIDALVSFHSNPVYDSASSDMMKELFSDESKVPFAVAIESAMSETATLADIVLPAATHLESWDLSVAPSYHFVPQVTLGQPAIAPRGESKSLAEIWILLASSIGGAAMKNLNYKHVEDYFKEIAAQVPGMNSAKDFDNLKKVGMWEPDNPGRSFVTYQKSGFATPSKKFEIASSELRRKGEFELPRYIPLQEPIQLSRNQLYLIPFTSNVMTPNTGNAKWLAEISHVNEAMINPRTAHKLGIRNGQKIRLKSKAGEIETEVRLSQGVHPRAIALRSGLGHWAMGNFALGKKVETADPDSAILWWEKQHNGVNTNILIEVQKDTLGLGLSEKDTIVSIEKA